MDFESHSYGKKLFQFFFLKKGIFDADQIDMN